jgi:hypothetical protein
MTAIVQTCHQSEFHWLPVHLHDSVKQSLDYESFLYSLKLIKLIGMGIYIHKLKKKKKICKTLKRTKLQAKVFVLSAGAVQNDVIKKVNFTLEQAMKAKREEYGYSSTLSLISAVDAVDVYLHALAALPPRKRPDTHFIGGWVGPRVGLDGCESLYRLSYRDPLTTLLR